MKEELRKIAYIIKDVSDVLYIADSDDLATSKNVWRLYYDKKRKITVIECSIDGIHGDWVEVPASVTPVVV